MGVDDHMVRERGGGGGVVWGLVIGSSNHCIGDGGRR